MADVQLQNESFMEGKPFSKVIPDMAYVDQIIGIGREKGYDIRKASVFCTPSLSLEYIHLDEIRSFDTDLIEMETSAFYYMADLFELPGIALLVVSDNSASGVPLVGRSEDEEKKYDYGRKVIIPDMILSMAAM
jgi:purine-nucleoside phosphorylase